jgi:tRNA A-37 threonylcarbamoyl transferase component Bud32
LRAEGESLLNYDRETFDSIHGRVAAAAAMALDADLVSTATDQIRADDASALRSDTGEGRFPAGTLLGDRYRIVTLLGRGGMGEVYRAVDLKLKQPVALKFLPEKMARRAELLARFHAEVRLARQISHPNVCRVYDIGDVDGAAYISMQYIDGEDLASLLRRIGRLPADKGLDIARRLCAGLAAAHDEGVIHRDLKPANIMIDRRGEVLITDFGLAKSPRELGPAEARSGTPAYMAPEQLKGQPVSVGSDIYSLGLVLYEMFSGRRPFGHRRQPEDRPPIITSVTREIDPAVVRAIGRCIELDPRDRPVSALAVAAALPGGTPLAEALAAGVTPSPQMVAASDEGAGISPRAALLNLVFVIVGLAAVVVVGSRVSILHLTPFEHPPEVLAQKARELIAALFQQRSMIEQRGPAATRTVRRCRCGSRRRRGRAGPCTSTSANRGKRRCRFRGRSVTRGRKRLPSCSVWYSSRPPSLVPPSSRVATIAWAGAMFRGRRVWRRSR